MTSEDPAVAYDTVSYEPVINVYQSLIAYNGSSSATFVPELSTCVPGAANGVSSTASVSCVPKYGQSLITDNAQGEPQYYTFPIDPAAHFYDSANSASWQVYPSDVMFSLARTLSFADLPGPAVLNGWIQAQSLLPSGNSKWDGGIHAPFNNTPENILGAMLVNDSTYCPALAMSQSGCITFNAFGGGTDWPFFLQLIADDLGAGVVPCGWFTAQGAGIPGWTGSTAAHGDGPCLLPGGVTSTTATPFQNYLTSLAPTAWDSFQELALNHPAVQPNVQYNMVGSGPYYIQTPMTPTTGYTLDASPAYQQPTGCIGVGGGCEPALGNYIKKVVIAYEPDDTVGIQQYVAGQADFAGISAPETSTMLQLESEGKIGILYSPTISTFFFPFDLNFSAAAEATIDPTGALNVPGDFFASNTVRELLTHAYPYTTNINTVFSVDGVHFGENYGGAIPIGMGNYYPTNISWPYQGGDACSGTTQASCNDSANSALWWWQQGTTSRSSPYYDAELAACSSTSPCKFPIIGELGAPSLDDAISNYIAAVKVITDGALQPYSFDLSFPDLVQYSSIPGGQNPMPYYNLGWAPDYPDPTDYMAAMYYANATYTLGDGLYQVLEANASYNLASCGHTSGSFADLTYWANLGQIPSSCQGPAYGAMLTWMGIAASLAPGAYRILVYNEVEHVENQLGFYTWFEQQLNVVTSAKWINNATINQNVMIGGGDDQTFYEWGYTSAVANVYFNETGLGATATSWSVQFAGQTYDNNVSSSTWQSIEIPAQTNGTYSWSINYVDSYTLAATNGSLTVVAPSSTGFTVAAAFSAYACAATCGTATFTEGGLESGTTWAVILQGLGSLTSNTSAIAFPSVTGSVTPYLYSVVPTVAYKTTMPANGSGSITVTAVTGGSASVFFTGLIFNTYAIVLKSTGLTAGSGSWSVKLNGVNNTTVIAGTTNMTIVFWEPIGTYPFTVYSTTGLTPISAVGQASVIGHNLPIAVPFTATPESLTFTETGLASGVGWGVTVAANDTNPHTAPGNSTTEGSRCRARRHRRCSTWPKGRPRRRRCGTTPRSRCRAGRRRTVSGRRRSTTLPTRWRSPTRW
ncbi:MAG: ABC transporter substrate-binding protein [Thermoplasmata archaeon]